MEQNKTKTISKDSLKKQKIIGDISNLLLDIKTEVESKSNKETNKKNNKKKNVQKLMKQYYDIKIEENDKKTPKLKKIKKPSKNNSIETRKKTKQSVLELGTFPIKDECNNNLSISMSQYGTELYQLSKDIVKCSYLLMNGIDLPDNNFIEEVLKRILPSINKKYTVVPKRRNRKLIPKTDMCMGRKIDGQQCTRRKINSTDYCKSHNRKRPNGRIDQEFINTKVKAKRGRKRKIEFDPRQTNENYITMWPEIINGDRRLIDIHGNVYSYDEKSPTFLGKKTLENKLVKI